ncbi:hypothetical protein [Mycobacterium phage MS810]|uniref:Uncharacterized protein n=4 Tax=Faithunavirus TaxID=2948705 RepID=A0A291I9W1_9CAUD|nr:hypothetical protein SEA_FAITH1_53 [Mycobacterium phage Faith1]YP_008410928.1 hypothetical protein N848_gp053 [Mycobacterium phage Crossroads]YP_009017277.1 hypothetical protein CL57_gp052 [Mycobacterium phage Rumpelstiltskin]YP_009292567.1 hypothetical protein BI025_gp053 [Mycobacterium phage Gardann]YP_010012891.1 hypothetical protein J4T96_gp053 [Mycobacterium phage Finemlucis]YP_010013021.1 hypothetical protein J4T97_gp052 [Mycobacterium phage GuuelaD]AGK87616.1 hypothetical protein PB
MSKKSLFKQPGVEQLIPGAELPVGVKVTGRNMHAVSLLASVSGEALGRRTIVKSYFEADGSLSHVRIVDEDGTVDIKAGDYMTLGDDRKTIVVVTPEIYASIKTVLPLVVALGDAFAEAVGTPIFDGLSGTFPNIFGGV